MVNCVLCKRSVRNNQKCVNCANCKDLYHTTCGHINDTLLRDIEQGISDWRCVSCRTAKNRKSIVSTGSDANRSVLSVPSVNRLAPTTSRSSSVSSLSTNHDYQENNESNNIADILKKLSENLKILTTSQQICTSSLAEMTEQMVGLQSLHTVVDGHDKKIQSLEAENRSMKALIKNLSSKFDNFEQKCNNCKVQINHVPVATNEDLHATVINIANKLGVVIEKNDIIDVFRSNGKKQKKKVGTAANGSGSTSVTDGNVSSGGSASNSGQHPADEQIDQVHPDNPIIVNFKSNAATQAILKSYRNITDHKLYFDNNNKQRIFICEYLISNRRRLFFKTKLFCKENQYKYLWTRNGSIFIRKQDGGKKILINSNTDFTSIEDQTGDGATLG